MDNPLTRIAIVTQVVVDQSAAVGQRPLYLHKAPRSITWRPEKVIPSWPIVFEVANWTVGN